MRTARSLKVSIVAVAAVAGSLFGAASAGAAPTHRPASTATQPATLTSIPGPPAGWTQRYTRDFAHTAGLGDWVVQPGAGATVLDSYQPGAQFGMGVKLPQVDQWAEIISSNAVVTANTFVQGLVYIPGASGQSGTGQSFPAGSTANWPAFWTFGNPWPNNGEIDMLEGQTGKSCEQTHYGTSGNVIDSQSFCGPVNTMNNGISTGWITVSMLRTGQQVKVWYGSTLIGTVPLPTNANEKLVFQNQSYNNRDCPQCFGPTLLGTPSTAWLSKVTVWSQ